MDYDQVLPRIFVGDFPDSAADIEDLRRDAGVTAVLNLQTDQDMSRFGLDWSLLEKHYRMRGMEVRRFPVTDFDSDDLRRKLPGCVRALDDMLRAGHIVYVHCSAGAGRSPSVVIAYLVWREDWKLDHAVLHVKKCRSCMPDLEAIRSAAPVRE